MSLHTLTTMALCLMIYTVPLALPLTVYRPDYGPKWLVFHLFLWVALVPLLVEGYLRRISLYTPFLLPAFSFLGIGCLSTLWNGIGPQTSYELYRQTSIVVLLLVAVKGALPQCQKQVLWVALLTGSFVSLIGILQAHKICLLTLSVPMPPSSTFVNRNVAAEYITCCALVALRLLLAERCRLSNLLVGSSGLALMLLFLVETRCRTAWLAVVCGVLIFYYHSQKSHRNLGILLMTLGTLLIMITSLIAFQLPIPGKGTVLQTVNSIIHPNSGPGAFAYTSRVGLWKGTLDMIKDYPILGVGPGRWFEVYPVYDQGRVLSSERIASSPHNDFLWIASEYGLLGLGCLVWFVVVVLRRAFSTSNFLQRVFLISFGLAYSVLSFFAFPKDHPQAPMLLCMALGMSIGRSDREHDRHWCNRLDLPLALFFVMMSLGSLALSWWQVLLDHHRFPYFFVSRTSGTL